MALTRKKYLLMLMLHGIILQNIYAMDTENISTSEKKVHAEQVNGVLHSGALYTGPIVIGSGKLADPDATIIRKTLEATQDGILQGITTALGHLVTTAVITAAIDLTKMGVAYFWHTKNIDENLEDESGTLVDRMALLKSQNEIIENQCRGHLSEEAQRECATLRNQMRLMALAHGQVMAKKIAAQFPDLVKTESALDMHQDKTIDEKKDDEYSKNLTELYDNKQKVNEQEIIFTEQNKG